MIMHYLQLIILHICVANLVSHSMPSSALQLFDYNSSFDGDPDVIVLGVQKSGTTSLARLLVDTLQYCIGKYCHYQYIVLSLSLVCLNCRIILNTIHSSSSIHYSNYIEYIF
jgi:hypothetical protein